MLSVWTEWQGYPCITSYWHEFEATTLVCACFGNSKQF